MPRVFRSGDFVAFPPNMVRSWNNAGACNRGMVIGTLTRDIVIVLWWRADPGIFLPSARDWPLHASITSVIPPEVFATSLAREWCNQLQHTDPPSRAEEPTWLPALLRALSFLGGESNHAHPASR